MSEQTYYVPQINVDVPVKSFVVKGTFTIDKITTALAINRLWFLITPFFGYDEWTITVKQDDVHQLHVIFDVHQFEHAEL